MRTPRFALLVLAVLVAGCTDPAPVSAPEPDPGPRLAWTEIPDGPTPRNEVVVGAIGPELFIIGGFTQVPPASVAQSLVEVYNTDTGLWWQARDYPLQIHHAAAVAMDGFLYVLGGQHTGAFQPTNLAFRYNPNGDLWEPIAPMPRPRGAHAAGVVEGKIYVAGGGLVGNGEAAVDVYDPATDSWTTLDAPLPTTRGHTGGVGLDGRFYVAAGDVNGHAENTDALEAYDPATRTWTSLAPVPTLRGSVAVAAWEGHVVVLGGQNGTQTFPTVEAYDPMTDTWTRLPDLNVPRHGFGTAVVDGRLYAVYGGPEPGAAVTGSIEVISLGGDVGQAGKHTGHLPIGGGR